MKTLPFREIREHFTEVANQVNYSKSYYLLTKNNKPMVGIVPPEAMQLLAEIFAASKTSKQIAKILEKYMLNISEEDFSLLNEMLENPPAPNEALLKAAESAKRKIKFNDEQSI
jgi:PHD/YefM family antitoxin component YafN of YafNO toxin-antitoxin module